MSERRNLSLASDNPEIERSESEVLDAEVVPEGPRRTRLGVDLQQNRYVSQLPSPDDLERYQKLIPDAAERLLAGGEREQLHRHEVEKRLVALDEHAMPQFYAGQRRGHWISLALGLGYEAVMAAAIALGHVGWGVTGALTGLAAMVWAVRRDSDSDTPPGSEAPSEQSR